jgi:hypothetical protein
LLQLRRQVVDLGLQVLGQLLEIPLRLGVGRGRFFPEVLARLATRVSQQLFARLGFPGVLLGFRLERRKR